MEEHRMTVYKGRGDFKEAPQILLQGRWLERDNRQILIFYEEFLRKLIPSGKIL